MTSIPKEIINIVQTYINDHETLFNISILNKDIYTNLCYNDILWQYFVKDVYPYAYDYFYKPDEISWFNFYLNLMRYPIKKLIACKVRNSIASIPIVLFKPKTYNYIIYFPSAFFIECSDNNTYFNCGTLSIPKNNHHFKSNLIKIPRYDYKAINAISNDIAINCTLCSWK